MPFQTIQYDHDLMNICRSMRPNDTILVDSILQGADLCRRRETLKTVPSKALLAENHEFDPFQNGFDTEADPIISSHDFKQRSSSPEDQNSPQIVRRSIGSSPECSSDEEKFRHKPWITETILEMIVVRDRLYQRMKSDPSADTSQTYKKTLPNVSV
jgi:hypothetical protein